MRLIEGKYVEISKYIHNTMNTTCFLFMLAYSDENSSQFPEINRFKEQSCAELAPFQNEYVGCSVIDLTEWADKPVNSKLEAFFYFLLDRMLSSRENKTVFISEKETSMELRQMISDMFGSIEYIDLGLKRNPVTRIGFIDREENESVRG